MAAGTTGVNKVFCSSPSSSPLQCACIRSRRCTSSRRSCWSPRGARRWTARSGRGAWSGRRGSRSRTSPQTGRGHSLQRTPIVTLPLFSDNSNCNHTNDNNRHDDGDNNENKEKKKLKKKKQEKIFLLVRNILILPGEGDGEGLVWGKVGRWWWWFTIYAKSPAETAPGG